MYSGKLVKFGLARGPGYCIEHGEENLAGEYVMRRVKGPLAIALVEVDRVGI